MIPKILPRRHPATGERFEVVAHERTKKTAREKRDDAATRKRARAARPQEKRTRDAAYLAFVRTHECMDCKRIAVHDGGRSAMTVFLSEVEAHHWAPKGYGAMGKKVDDRRTVPLCAQHHNFFHRNGCMQSCLHDYRGMETHALFLEKQVELLIEWTIQQKESRA